MKKVILSLFIVATVMAAIPAMASGNGWLTNFDEAKEEAAAKNLPILADFSGSDWCGWCIKLDKEVFSKASFKAYAKKNLVLLLVDFPSSKSQSADIKSQNQKLAKKYGVRGYPTVLLLDKDGKVIGKTGYQPGGPEKYIKSIKAMLAKS